jgi:zinc/manganese transport system substrate-binding protein
MADHMENAMTRLFRHAAALVFLSAVSVTAAVGQERIKVVASFSILADIVRQIAAERVDVTSLVPPDADAHVYQPTPADSKALAGAALVVLNGLGFEGWADRLVKASGYKGAIVVATKGLKTLTGDDHRSADSGSRGHNHDHDADPHAWQNVANVQTYVANIRDALIAADSAGQSSYQARAEAYLAELAQLDGSIKSVYANIPKAQRTIITHHDAFAYYGKAYGIKFIAPQGVTGDSEPSARDVAALIRQIRKEKAKAVFVENINNGRLIEQIVRDTGAAIGGKLYSDALSAAGGPASTYIDMMRHNTRLMSDALVAANAPAQKPTPGARDAR